MPCPKIFQNSKNCRNCKKKLPEKNKSQETSDTDTSTAMASHHLTNNESKVNEDSIDPSRQWIRNVGLGSTKTLSLYHPAKNSKLSKIRQRTNTTRTTNTAQHSYIPNETIVHRNDIKFTAMVESEAQHSTLFETSEISSDNDCEANTFTGKPSKNAARKCFTTNKTKIHHTDIDITAMVESEAQHSILITETTKVREADTSTSYEPSKNREIDDTIAIQLNALHTKVDNIAKPIEQISKERASENYLTLERENLDFTLVPNHETVAIVPTPKKFVSVHMTEQKLCELMKKGLITFKNSKFIYD